MCENAHEKICCAALRFEIDGEVIIEKGMSHSDCMCFAVNRYGLSFYNRDKEKDEQGFVTTTDRFVNRSDAFIIARVANQFKEGFYNPDKTWLDSYQINFALE